MALFAGFIMRSWHGVQVVHRALAPIVRRTAPRPSKFAKPAEEAIGQQVEPLGLAERASG